jgi:hypothetical protein
MTDDGMPVSLNVPELLAEVDRFRGFAGLAQFWLVSIVAPLNGFSLPGDPHEICQLEQWPTDWPWARLKRVWPRLESLWPLGPDGRRYHAHLLRWQRQGANLGLELREHVH